MKKIAILTLVLMLIFALSACGNTKPTQLGTSDFTIVLPDGYASAEDDFDEDYKPSKWEITKNVAKYFAQKFVYDLKSYVKFYPLMQVAQFITYIACFLPGYAVYKKTGFDVIASFSKFAANHQNFAIFAQNLYNSIPMTLASLIYKYGQQAFAYTRS